MINTAAALRVQSDDVVYLREVAPRWFADQQARRPKDQKSWMSPYARRLVEAKQKANSPENAAITPPPAPVEHSGQIRPIARPQATRQSILDKIARLPPVDEVMATMALLVPTECLAYQGFPHFLMACHLSKDECHVTEEMTVEETSEVTGHHVEDAKTLSRTELRKLYPLTYKSWDNMKRRAQVPVHRRFEQFPDFLIEAGPRPGKSYTLDRIAPSDPEYAPGKVRWATKREQANNRRITIRLTHDGETLAAADWERQTMQRPGTIRQRRNRHPEWTDERVIYGEGGKIAFYAERGGGFAIRPWYYHGDEARREEAERFYQEYKHPGESPLVFCLSILREGMEPWDDFFRDYVDPCEEYGPELDEGGKMVLRLEPVRAWLERTLPKNPAQTTKPARGPYRQARFRYEDHNLRDEARAELDAERAYDRAYQDDD